VHELDAIARLTDALARWGRVEVLAEIEHARRRWPVHAITLGRGAPTEPAFLVVGGVHGLERIGTEVAIAYLQTLIAQLAWDELLHHALETSRLLVVPLVNPVGMATRTRSNGNGVDLMRNAPGGATGFATPLVGGQSWTPRLPWYTGRAGATMEPEAAALVAFVERELFASRFAISIDLHSGFGLVDRIWYPYARTREHLPDLDKVEALHALLDDTLPNHVYQVEQTARVYTIRGDLWDHLYDRRRAAGPGTLLPLTLEMGTWALWVGRRRHMRRHLLLLDFLFRAARSSERWISTTPAPRG
jgi:hypothetical protein